MQVSSRGRYARCCNSWFQPACFRFRPLALSLSSLHIELCRRDTRNICHRRNTCDVTGANEYTVNESAMANTVSVVNKLYIRLPECGTYLILLIVCIFLPNSLQKRQSAVQHILLWKPTHPQPLYRFHYSYKKIFFGVGYILVYTLNPISTIAS